MIGPMSLGTGIIGGGRPVAIEYAAVGLSSTNPTNSYNFGTVNMATVRPARTMVLIISSTNANISGDQNVTSVSLAGQAMTKQAQAQSGSAARTIWTLPEASSASGNLTINRSIGNGFQSAYWVLWALYNLKDIVPLDAQFANTGNPSSSFTLSTLANGAVIAFAESANSGSDVTWTNVTSDVVQVGGVSSSARIYGASALTTSASSLTVTASRGALVQASGASFR